MRDEIRISVTGSTPPEDTTSYWLNLTTDQPEEASTISKIELADWIDSAFGTADYCTGAISADAYSPGSTSDSPEKRLQDVLSGEACFDSSSLLGLQGKCSLSRRTGQPVKKTVYVHWSSLSMADQYRFVVTSDVSPNGPTRSGSTIRVTVDFTDLDYAPVNRYADNSEVSALWVENSPEWLGDVLIGKAIVNSATIGVGWSSGKITLTQKVSGRLTLLLPIQYDMWSVSIPGIVSGDKREYQATAYAFSDLLPDPASVELSDEQDEPQEGSDCDLCGGSSAPILDGDFTVDGGTPGTGGGSVTIVGGESTCTARRDWEIRNRCTTELINSGTISEDCTCPSTRTKTVSYTPEGTPESAKLQIEDYKEECCTESPILICVPECRKITADFAGGATITPSEDSFRASYPSSIVRFVRVRPEGGCGVRVDEFAPAGSCNECEDVEPLVYSPLNPTVIAPGGSVAIEVTGGRVPIQWSLSGGTGYYFEGGATVGEGGRIVAVFAENEMCGSTTVVANDGCSSVNGPLDYANGLEFWDISATVISPGGLARVYILAGTGNSPYTWSLSGDGFAFVDGTTEKTTTLYYIDIYATIETCDDCTISVSDACSSTARVLENSRVAIEFWTISATTISPGAFGRVYKQAGTGIPPYNWSLSGEGYTFSDGSTEKTTNLYYVDIYLDSDSCDAGSVEVSDECSSAVWDIENGRVDLAYWDISSDSIFPGSYGRVYLLAGTGIPPYTYTLSGEGFKFSNGTNVLETDSYYVDIYLDAESCDAGGVEVRDACSSVTLGIENLGLPVAWDSNNDQEVCPGGTLRLHLAIGTGQHKFSYSVTGGLEIIGDAGPTYTRYVDIINNGTGGSVEVTDPCGTDGIFISEPQDC